jgi:hypothetical protein
MRRNVLITAASRPGDRQTRGHAIQKDQRQRIGARGNDEHVDCVEEFVG